MSSFRCLGSIPSTPSSFRETIAVIRALLDLRLLLVKQQLQDLSIKTDNTVFNLQCQGVEVSLILRESTNPLLFHRVGH